jgi:hypothetical protein
MKINSSRQATVGREGEVDALPGEGNMKGDEALISLSPYTCRATKGGCTLKPDFTLNLARETRKCKIVSFTPPRRSTQTTRAEADCGSVSEREERKRARGM